MTHSFPTRRASDLLTALVEGRQFENFIAVVGQCFKQGIATRLLPQVHIVRWRKEDAAVKVKIPPCPQRGDVIVAVGIGQRSEEHTSELQSLMRISYAVFCLKKKTNRETTQT